MCAEAVWWRCHRRIIADYLIAAHEVVCHILGPGQVDFAKLTPGASVRQDGSVVYSPAVSPPIGAAELRRPPDPPTSAGAS